MFCKYCGQKIDGDSVFCKSCGKNITIDSHVSEPIVQTPIYKEPDIQKPIYREPVVQQPIYQTPIIQKPVYQAPIVQEPTMHTPVVTQEPKTKTYIPDFDPASVYPHMDEATQTEPAPKIEYKRIPEAPTKPKKKRNINFLPYLLMPAGHITAIILAAVIMALISGLFAALTRDTDFRYSPVYYFVQNIISGSIMFIYTLLVAVASLCCKGIHKKGMFVGSLLSGQVSGIITSFLTVIVGYIVLYTSGFNSEGYDAFWGAQLIITCVIGLLVWPGVSLLLFAWSQKYTVIKEEKPKAVEIILPCIFIALYLITERVLWAIVSPELYSQLQSIFVGEYVYTFVSVLNNLIITIINYAGLFLLGLACKGGYRKVAFIGSIFFSNMLFNFVYYVSNLISELAEVEITYVDDIVKTVLAIPVAIVIYTLLNKYVVEKTKKIKE